METDQMLDIDSERGNEADIDPINDIIDYLVRCANISFKNAHVDEAEVRTSDKIRMAYDLFKRSPTEFLMQFGKYLTSYHIGYFEKLQLEDANEIRKFEDYLAKLKDYHSAESTRKRIRNRRYKALQKLQEESDYFSEKQMMYRNPLLYEQLVGQYLTDEEIIERDGVDRENLTFLNMILETVDKNQMREMKNEQMIEEDEGISATHSQQESKGESNQVKPHFKKQWGDFETPDATPSFKPETRKQSIISAPERKLLREEFFQEMYSSFIEGRDEDYDYSSIDNDEQYDDLHQVSQDEEDKYFDSETNETENLEEHMRYVQEYGRKKSNDSGTGDDPLDVFMKHIAIKQNLS